MDDSGSSASLLDLVESSGYYILVFKLEQGFKGMVGRRHHVSLEPGDYVYIGSALAPFKLRNRVCRHLSRYKKPWWHIDYVTLSPSYKPLLVALCPSTSKGLEPLLALSAYSSRCFKPIGRLGGSDDAYGLPHLYMVQGCETVNAVIGLVASTPCRTILYNAHLVYTHACHGKTT